MIRQTIRLGLPCLAALLAPVLAEAAPIGSAVAVRPAAQSEGTRGTQVLARGSDLEAFDRVRTNAGGNAKLRFLDASTLDVGPGALVTLDRFVFNPDRSAAQASLTMAKGTFRWVSGRSPKEAYDLKTPLATIGIRGTDIRVFAQPEVTTVRLQSGAIRACSRISGQCADINRPGQGVRLWQDGRVETFGPGTQQTAPVRRASVPPGPPDDGGYPPFGVRPPRGGYPPPATRPPQDGPSPADVIGPAISIGIGILGTRGPRPSRGGMPTRPMPQPDMAPTNTMPNVYTPR